MIRSRQILLLQALLLQLLVQWNIKMGRLIKNLELESRSYAIRLPVGDSSIPLQSQNPVDGQVYFNSASSNMEVYFNNAWHGVGQIGRVLIQKDSYLGDGSTFVYAMTNSYLTGNETEIIVFIGGVFQEPGVAYTVNGYNITFTSTPNLNLPIVILHNFNSTDVQ